jgi:hypothetical protein
VKPKREEDVEALRGRRCDYEGKREILQKSPLVNSQNDKITKMNCFCYLFLASKPGILASTFPDLFPYFFKTIPQNDLKIELWIFVLADIIIFMLYFTVVNILGSRRGIYCARYSNYQTALGSRGALRSPDQPLASEDEKLYFHAA